MRGQRSDATALCLAVPAIAHPVLDYETVTRELSIAPATAFRALESLAKSGVLRPAISQRRSRILLAEPVFNSLDELAARAGRRRLRKN